MIEGLFYGHVAYQYKVATFEVVVMDGCRMFLFEVDRCLIAMIVYPCSEPREVILSFL